MFRRTFKVTFRPMKNNFVILPESYYNLVSTYENGCLSMAFGNYCHYVTWASYRGSVQDTEIGINARVAKEMGLNENDLVKCTLIADTMMLKSVHVTPVSSKDWEIIELCSDKIQSSLLDQTRVVNATQFLIVWINRSMKVTLTVDKIRPNLSFGRIDHNTEVIVAPNLYNKSNILENDSNELNGGNYQNLTKSKTYGTIPAGISELSRSTTTKNIKSLQHSPSVIKVNRLDKMQRLIKDLKKENSRTFEFRVISGKWEGGQISDIFVTKNNLPEFMDLNQIYCMKTSEQEEYYVTVKVVRDGDNFPNNIYQTIEVNENLMKLLKIHKLEKITLKPKQMVLNFLEKIELFAHKKTHYKVIESSFKRYVVDNTQLSPMLLNQGQVVRLEEELYVTVKITPEHFRYCLIDSAILKECKLYAADIVTNVDELLDVEIKEESVLSVKDLIKIPKFDSIVDHLINQIKSDLCLDQNNSILRQGNILIYGQSNTGKIVIVERILEQLVKKPYCCYYDMFYCTRSKGRKVESIQKDLRQIFTSSLNNAPSVIVLKNLDILAHATSDQPTQDGEYFNRISDAIQHLIVEYTTTNPIAVIGTITDIKSLNRRLYSPRGRHLFHTITKVPDLEREDREIFLKELCSHVDSEQLNIEKFSNLTEGYNIGDLVQFIERAIFYAYRISKSHPVLTNDLLKKSLENTNAYCLEGIENHKRSDDINDNITVNDIAGLETVVSVLEEVLMWPSRYPTIFGDSPLRNQAGVLLYGPPGTGKTFLVSQISHSWNLRTISVKGPELLAKYVGQSEENVRNLFNRARSAKPCVLFFDEFDSLAPKRGHDSTGVTDRVVNQLLTELDGVEGLQGVIVIAATSRPELLDPALLRSGRIDRIVECPLPDTNARLRIFKSLSHSLHLDKSVKFKELADKTEFYTGADIQSILTTANMTAIKEILKKCGPQNTPNKIFITQNHLMDSFNTTRPSLSPTDILRYRQTYARFTNKKNTSRDFVAKRATLA